MSQKKEGKLCRYINWVTGHVFSYTMQMAPVCLKYKLQCIIQAQYVILSITGIYYNILYNTQYIIIKQSGSVSKTDVVNSAELSWSSKFPSSDVARRQC